MIKVAIFATHPVQYQVPWFRELGKQAGIDLTVYYGLLPDAAQQGVGFDTPFNWDIPLLIGYRWIILQNLVRCSDLDGFFGIRIPIADLFKLEKPDAAIITGWHSLMLLQVLALCSLKGIPCIVRGESNALYKRKGWMQVLHRLILWRFDAYLAIGKSNSEFYLQNNITAGHIFPCPYFIDNKRFQSQFETLYGKRDNLRFSWCIPSGKTCFLYVGKLISKKRIMDLLSAFRLALRYTSTIYLLIVGSGKLMDDASRFVKRHRLPVSFAGFLNQSEIAGAYIAADCLVLPSDFGETWGLVVNEAMVCRLPAIVSNRVGCAPDLIEEGRTGTLYPFGDIDALALKIVKMAASKRKLREMGDRARKQIIENYSVEKALDGTLQALEMVLKKYR